MAAKSQSKPVHAADTAAERSPRGADHPAGRPPLGADQPAERGGRAAERPHEAQTRQPPDPDSSVRSADIVAALEQSVAALNRTAQSLLEQQARIADRLAQGAEGVAGRLPQGAGRAIPLATVSLRDAYPFPEPHFSADVVSSQVDQSRPVGSQKSAQLTYHESAGLLAVRGVRRDKSEWTCLIPASNIKGMRVLEEGK